MQNRRTGEFDTDQVGSFVAFEKAEDEFGLSLYGIARIPKRNKKVYGAIRDLFDDGDLNCSFEISAGTVTMEDDVICIDASENNKLIAMAIVSFPAYPEATALELAAEISREAIENRLFSGTQFLAEVDIETVRRWTFDALAKFLGDCECLWHFRVLMFCPDCIILYDEQCGGTFKAEYRIDDDAVDITDFYEIVYTRKEGNTEMNLEEAMNRIAELEAQINTMTEQLAECNGKLENKDAECNGKLTEKDAELAEKDSQIAELNQYKTKVEEMEAEKLKAETEAKQNNLTEYAKKNGLDVENEVIAQFVNDLNYESIFAEIQKIESEKEVKTVSASFDSIKQRECKKEYGGLLDRAE